MPNLKRKMPDTPDDDDDDVDKLSYRGKCKEFLECLKTGNRCGMDRFLPDGVFWSPVQHDDKLSELPWVTFSEDKLFIKPLEVASIYGHVEIVQNLLALEQPASQSYGKQEAILQAARAGHKECFHLLVENGFLKANDRDHERYSQEIKTVKSEASLKSVDYRTDFDKDWSINFDNLLTLHGTPSLCLNRDHERYSQEIETVKAGDFAQIEASLKSANYRTGFDRDWPIDFMNLLIVHGCPSSCLKVLVDQKIEVNWFDRNGLTPLMCAILAENLEALRFLLKHGVNISSQILTADCSMRKTALMYAATLQNSDCLEAMLSYCSKDDINVKQYKFKRTALTYACLYGNTKSVKLLIESGAEVEIKDHLQNNLIIAAMDSENVDCMKLILESVSKDNFKFIVNEKAFDLELKLQNSELFSVFLDHFPLPLDTIFGDGDGRTLLGLAVSYGFEEVVRSLLEKGANIDCIDTSGETALMCSCQKGHQDLTKLLIDNGANVNLQSKDGSSAAMYAVRFRQRDCLKQLMAANADLNLSTNSNSVFSLALQYDNDSCMKLLLDDSGKLLKDGALNIVSSQYDSCRHVLNSVKALTLVLNAGLLDWDSCNSHNLQRICFTAVSTGICPGKFQCKNNYDEVSRKLSEAGLLEQEDKYEKVSPLVLAISEGNYPVVKYLLANLYFYVEDYNRLRKEETFNHYSLSKERSLVSELLDSVTYNPMRLQAWSFLAASKAISTAGPPTQRQERVEALPIPDKLKRFLKFQTKLSKTCCTSWNAVDDFSPCDLIFSQNRMSAFLGNSNPFCEHCRV